MARLDRHKNNETKSVPVRKRNKTVTTKTLYKVLVAHFIFTIFANYDKIAQLYSEIVKILGY